MNKRALLIAIALITMLPATLLAEVTSIGNKFPSIGRSVRPLGMGNSFLTMKGTDLSPIFYNPAAIADYGNEITWVTGMPIPQIQLGYDAIQLTRDVFNFKDDINKATTDAQKTALLDNFVNSHSGKLYGLDIFLPVIGAYNRYFSAAVIVNGQLDISFRNTSTVNFEISSKNYSGLVLGTAIPLLDDSLKIGVAGKVLYGVENQQTITNNSIINNNMHEFEWKNWKRGLGVGVDAGVKYEIYDFGQDWIDTLKPTVAATWQNINQTRWIAMKKNGGPSNLPQDISAGFGIHPTLGPVESSFDVDIREINRSQDFLMRLHAGAEFRLPARYMLSPSIRVGCNQGYPAVGVGLNIGQTFIWNVAFYGEEAGVSSRQKGVYRLANEFTWSF